MTLREMGVKYGITPVTACRARKRGYFMQLVDDESTRWQKLLELTYRLLVIEAETEWHWQQIA